MDTQSMTMVTDPWLQVLDRELFALPAAAWFRDRMFAQAHASAAKLPQPVPMLNWPPTLFDDVVLHH